MKSKIFTFTTALSLLVGLAVPVQLAAQDKQAGHHKHHHYKLVDMGTFGGPNSSNAWAGIGNTLMNSGGTVPSISPWSKFHSLALCCGLSQ